MTAEAPDWVPGRSDVFRKPPRPQLLGRTIDVRSQVFQNVVTGTNAAANWGCRVASHQPCPLFLDPGAQGQRFRLSTHPPCARASTFLGVLVCRAHDVVPSLLTLPWSLPSQTKWGEKPADCAAEVPSAPTQEELWQLRPIRGWCRPCRTKPDMRAFARDAVRSCNNVTGWSLTAWIKQSAEATCRRFDSKGQSKGAPLKEKRPHDSLSSNQPAGDARLPEDIF
jgi:hypothetical protein